MGPEGGIWDAGAALGGCRAAGMRGLWHCGRVFSCCQALEAERSLQQCCAVVCSSWELQQALFVRREWKKKKEEPGEFRNKL